MKLDLKLILSLLGIVFLIWAVWFFFTVVLYILLSIVLAFVLGPLVDFLDEFKIWKYTLPRTLATVLGLVFFLLVFYGFFRVFVPVIADQVYAVSTVEQSKIDSSFAQPMADLQKRAKSLNINLDQSSVQSAKKELMHFFNVDEVKNAFQSTLGIVGSFLGGLFSVLFISFFLLNEKYLLYRIMHVITPKKHEPAMQRSMRGIKVMLGRYFRGILLQIFVYTFYIWLGLTIFGVEYALTIGFFAGLINLVPYIGPFIGLGFGVALGITSHLGYEFYSYLVPLMGKISIVFLVAMLLDNFFSYPLIFSNSLKAHPLEIFLVILIAGTLGGIGAMIVAMPVYTVLRVIAKEFLIRFEVIKSLTKDI